MVESLTCEVDLPGQLNCRVMRQAPDHSIHKKENRRSQGPLRTQVVWVRAANLQDEFDSCWVISSGKSLD